MSDVKITVNVHHATLGEVTDLFSGPEFFARPDEKRTVIAHVGDVTLFFDDAVKAHDFATQLHTAVEEIWTERARARDASPAPEN